MAVKSKEKDYPEDLQTQRPPRGRRKFLGSDRLCGLWIPGFVELACPLYEATMQGKTLLNRTPQTEKDFN